MTVKLSVSLADDDLALLDRMAERFEGNRSAAIHEALRVVREQGAREDYEQAILEWESSGDAETWESAIADGLDS
jgi:Arc/MetJ-type ribon-helix-helix transcriptional regulator